jgi:YidC/Oxa1 family membrane protein insertase
MSFAQILYNLTIGPLSLLFESIFVFIYSRFSSSGIAILCLSLIINILVLPLYQQADALQKAEMAQEKRLKPGVDHIKKTFKGDKQYMILQAYYRENHYQPANVIRGSLPLLLEIPFFIAAYRFLSGTTLMEGEAFWFIRDLSAPDGLLNIAGRPVNVLPVAMTVINLLSSAVYSHDAPRRTKLQLLVMALIFLVLLYDCPAGLVFYWTLNNLFSLGKNLISRLPHRKAVVCLLQGALDGAMICRLTTMPGHSRKFYLLAAGAGLLWLILIVLQACGIGEKLRERTAGRGKGWFWAGGLFLTLLTGLLIPSSVLASSVQEFAAADRGVALSTYLVYTLTLAAGVFLVWLGIYDSLARSKPLFGAFVWAAALCAVVDYLFFGTDLGTLSTLLVYDGALAFSRSAQILNLVLLAAVAAGGAALFFRKNRWIPYLYAVMIAAVLVMGGLNGHTIAQRLAQSDPTSPPAAGTLSTRRFPISRRGHNVVVIMMDRMIGEEIPYEFKEDPRLASQFTGFTYYSHTVSWGLATNVGVTPLFGGYDYIPEEMNRRSDVSLAQKHNEAIHVMPVLFLEHGYTVTVSDISYAGYRWDPDLAVYDDYPQIRRFYWRNSAQAVLQGEDPQVVRASRMRNFFAYSVMKIAPAAVQYVLYNRGTYNGAHSVGRTFALLSPTTSQGIQSGYSSASACLLQMPQMTEVIDSDQDTFFMFANDATHEPSLLQAPEYRIDPEVDNTVYLQQRKDDGTYEIDGRTLSLDNGSAAMHYCVNIASLKALGRWLDFLKENGVYDNTRIIIVADHGWNSDQFSDRTLPDGRSVEGFFPALLVKDFNAQGPMVTDTTLMTNADTPILAVQGLMEDPVNPYTGNPLNNDAAKHTTMKMLETDWQLEKNNGTQFLPGDWYALTGDDPTDLDNWSYLGNY